MAITVYGRRYLADLGRQLDLTVVQAAGCWLTTADHQHWICEDDQWRGPLPWVAPRVCGVPLGSCSLLFGLDAKGVPNQLMLGACTKCAAGPGEGHHYLCPTLDAQLTFGVAPDLWPSPVHRPQWVDDPRRHLPDPRHLLDPVYGGWFGDHGLRLTRCAGCGARYRETWGKGWANYTMTPVDPTRPGCPQTWALAGARL